MYKAIRLSFLAPFVLGGCASMFLNGAEMADHDYAGESRANYRVNACKASDGSAAQSPEATYHLIPKDGKLALFERSPDGSGVLITNQWAGPDGTHYFTWVQSSGWEYIVNESSPNAKRIAYANFQSAKSPDGSTRPTSPPVASCELTKS